MCLSDLSYDGSKGEHVAGTAEELGPSDCFQFMNTEYPQIQVLVSILSISSLKSNIYLLFILRLDIEQTVYAV